MELIEPKEFKLNGKTFMLGKFPAIQGRELITQYPSTALPKIGDYPTNEALMLKLMSFVGVLTEAGTVQRLTTAALVDNHVRSGTDLLRIEFAMMEYNCDFFADGKASSFLAGLGEKVQQLLTKTLMDLSQQSLAKTKPR